MPDDATRNYNQRQHGAGFGASVTAQTRREIAAQEAGRGGQTKN
jgi:hypothetical protein